MAEQALSDVKVIDLSHYIAGPYCAKMFADYGAEVIKVEPPGEGDAARRLGPFPGDIPHPEKGGVFLHLNTNKKSLTLNLETKTGQKILKELVKDADILMESYAPGTMESLGLGYEELEKVNPRLLMASITPFGQSGPYRDYLADEMILYALSGVMWVTGMPDREPVKIGNYASLCLAGATFAAMTIGTFWGARFKDLGQHLDVSIMECLASSMDRGGPNLMSVAYNNDIPSRRSRGTRISVPPSGTFPCKDGFVYAITSVNWWGRLCNTIDRPDMINDPYWTEHFYDEERFGEFDAIWYGWLSEQGKQEIMEKAQTHGLPITAVNTMDDVFRDPHLRQRGFFTEIEHPIAGTFEYPGPPFRMMKTPARVGRAPLLGEHNEEILCGGLGYSKEDLVRLRERGVI